MPATTVCAGAVVAGLFANNMAEHHGFTAPFNIAIVPLGACLVVIAVRWQENYGAQGLTSAGSFHEALAEMSKNHSIVIVGLISALFEVRRGARHRGTTVSCHVVSCRVFAAVFW